MSGNKARHTTPQNKLRSPCVVFTNVQSVAQAAGRSLSFADLVVIAKEFYPIPFRTRPSKPSASMVLRLKPRESRTLPGLPRAEIQETRQHNSRKPRRRNPTGLFRWCACRSQPRVALGRAKAPGGFCFCPSAVEKRGNVGRKQLVQHEIGQQVLRKALGHIVPPQHMQA